MRGVSQNMNAIAFSLYGSDPKYCVGMVRNAELAAIVYPGWTVVVYLDASVPQATQSALLQRMCVLKYRHQEPGMFWRFHINDQPDVERYLIRDADSRL